ncbi:hypothetical protein J4223_00415 [Candidatus Woesearchaeota archaeon]|nr:hypothetical protein [Candidatus Woesearchaeota archaeon]
MIDKMIEKYLPPSTFVGMSLFFIPGVINEYSKPNLENILFGIVGIACFVAGTYDIVRKVRDSEYKSQFFNN